jgi:hypothetical protein
LTLKTAVGIRGGDGGLAEREASGQAGWGRDSSIGKPLKRVREGMSHRTGSSHGVTYAATRNLAMAGAHACSYA